MAGRRTSLASLAGAKVEDVPGRSDAVLLSLPLDRLHCTRFNPRRNFGTDEELREFGEKLKKEQLQPAVVVSRAAYLKLWPGEADNVGACPYVIANGERRYRASKIVGRGVLEVVHREDVASSRAAFLDAVQSENNDRQNLDPIERAIAIDTMVAELGGADQVAVYYGKTKGWVSQQRKLLKLTPSLQDLVSSGELPVRVARDIAGLPAEVQQAAWDEELAKRQAAREAAALWKSDRESPRPAPGGPLVAAASPVAPAAAASDRFTAVNQQPPPPAATSANGTGQPDWFTAVNRVDGVQAEAEAEASVASLPGADPVAGLAPAEQPLPSSAEPAPRIVPEPRPKPIPDGVPLPYEDGFTMAHHLILKMPPHALGVAVRILNDYTASRSGPA